MPVAHPKADRYLRLTAFLLLSIGRLCFAQNVASKPVSMNVSAESSSSLPDAPEPQVAADSAPKTAGDKTESITLAGTPRRLLGDQKAIWTSPLHLQPTDAIWLAPLGATTGLLIGSDQHTMTSLIHINASDQSKFNTLSDAGVGALGAIPASMYLWSLFNDAPQAHEAGLLTGEAVADSLAVNEVGKFVSLRRPNGIIFPLDSRDCGMGHGFSDWR